MKWRKRGRVFVPGGGSWWSQSHAHLPTAAVRGDGRIRVYYAALDDDSYGRIGYVDLDAEDPSRVLFEAPEPVLGLGELGGFDDSGVTPSCVIDVGGETWLYYIGWQRTGRAPYQLFTGLAISRDGGATFERYSRAPILDRTDDEPFSRGAPFVRANDGAFRMWYWSCFKWSVEDDRVHYNNEVRLAESRDGVHWTPRSIPCLVPEGPEYSIGRPWVVRDGELFRMWYSVRSHGLPYRLGYAESRDGLTWRRLDDEVGLESSAEGWDSEMVCYPCVVDAAGARYLFYNGNGHGRTGFGYAVLEG